MAWIAGSSPTMTVEVWRRCSYPPDPDDDAPYSAAAISPVVEELGPEDGPALRARGSICRR
jgi:hypothetical protein